ncbi:MAG: LysR substrate-binding domain-containing protein, partial [Gemmatimonadaceae bacterium]
DRALAERGISPQIALTLGSTEAIKQAVMAGLGLAVVSQSAVSEHLAAGTLNVIDVRNWNVRRDLTLLRLRGRAPSAAARRFEEMIGT